MIKVFKQKSSFLDEKLCKSLIRCPSLIRCSALIRCPALIRSPTLIKCPSLIKSPALIQWIPDIWIHSKSEWNVVLKLILKCLTAVILSHWSAQKESWWDVRSFKKLNTIYENICKYHCRVISFLIIFKKLFFIFSSR